MLAITRILAINDDPEISESGRYRRLIELLLEVCTFSLFFSKKTMNLIQIYSFQNIPRIFFFARFIIDLAHSSYSYIDFPRFHYLYIPDPQFCCFVN